MRKAFGMGKGGIPSFPMECDTSFLPENPQILLFAKVQMVGSPLVFPLNQPQLGAQSLLPPPKSPKGALFF